MVSSSPFNCCNGVRQGSILSPYFFIVYLDELSVKLSQCNCGCYISRTLLNHLLYADDIVLFAPTIIGLQKLINICENYGNDFSIRFSLKKSECLYYKGKNLDRVIPSNVTIYGQNIEFKEETRNGYLGHYLRNDCSDDKDIKNQVGKLYARSYSLVKKFYDCSDNVKVKLFKSVNASIYCAPLWVTFSLNMYNRIRVAYNKSLRKILDLPFTCSASDMFAYANVQNFTSVND